MYPRWGLSTSEYYNVLYQRALTILSVYNHRYRIGDTEEEYSSVIYTSAVIDRCGIPQCGH